MRGAFGYQSRRRCWELLKRSGYRVGQTFVFYAAGGFDDAGVVPFGEDDAAAVGTRAVLQAFDERMRNSIPQQTAVVFETFHVVADGFDSGSDRNGEDESRGVPEEAPEH